MNISHLSFGHRQKFKLSDSLHFNERNQIYPWVGGTLLPPERWHAFPTAASELCLANLMNYKADSE